MHGCGAGTLHSMHPTSTYSLAPDTGTLAVYAGRTGVAVAEIAGRDSIAAVISVAGDPTRDIEIIVPTAVITGTEYGDPSAPVHAAEYLTERLPGIEFAPLAWVGDQRLWAALNGRFASVIAERFGIWSPCLACHLYMHLARIPLARALGSAPVIAGERETHDGRIKYSQTALSIDICTEVLASVGIELLEPLRHANGDDVDALVSREWAEAIPQLECVHSGNYLPLDGPAQLDEVAYGRYAEEFLRPAGLALAAALASLGTSGDERPDYRALVRDVLSEGD